MTELQLHTRSCSWTNQVAHLPLGFADSCGIYSESLKKFNKHDQLILEVKIVKNEALTENADSKVMASVLLIDFTVVRQSVTLK